MVAVDFFDSSFLRFFPAFFLRMRRFSKVAAVLDAMSNPFPTIPW